ncbi:MAG TPA: ABC transporter ATP-binding protein [Symbiobacteriaceae bacterium]|nr:ABC transporter ATP-binding protein [Symbiobacteriaceae bacterium]
MMLRTVGLTKAFGGLTAVSDLDLQVAPGEIHGLIGPNGSGKTTTLNLISGLYTPDKGEILLDGAPIARRRPSYCTGQGLARTFQNIRLFPRLSVLDNVAMARHARTRANLLEILIGTPAQRQEEKSIRAAAEAALELVGLSHRANDRPTDLPYGAQRLLEIARAMATDPKLLLLDEPAAGMNPTEKRELLALIQLINRERGITVLVIDHDMHMIMTACHRITVLNFGAKIASGSPAEVRRNGAVIEAYLGRGHRHA